MTKGFSARVFPRLLCVPACIFLQLESSIYMDPHEPDADATRLRREESSFAETFDIFLSYAWGDQDPTSRRRPLQEKAHNVARSLVVRASERNAVELTWLRSLGALRVPERGIQSVAGYGAHGRCSWSGGSLACNVACYPSVQRHCRLLFRILRYERQLPWGTHLCEGN